ncbi:MAG: glycosyltransferase family 2 protein [Chthoniobacterales bacterium]|nr:glycosyltransferase family 2 protein [Chthoniobacterales bacterium]
MNRPDISVVSPVYHAANLVHELVDRLRKVLGGMNASYEIVLVEDGSPDGSWPEIEKACRSYPEVRGVKLSRNFGQHYAISAALARARGARVVVMDCDLQDQPEEIPKLIATADEGYDIVLARRVIRQDSWLKRTASRLFYRVLGWLTGLNQDPAVANFGVYGSEVVAAINSMPESVRYFPTMVQWAGFRSTSVDVAHAARAGGKTSYNFKKLFALAVDISLVNSDKPLRLVVTTGFAVALIGFVLAARMLVLAFEGRVEVLGYASLIVSLWFLSGLIILIIGVVGLYVGKTFEGVKRRPPYVVAKEINATAD